MVHRKVQQRRRPVGYALHGAVAEEGDGGPLQWLRLWSARLLRRYVQVVAVRPHVLRAHQVAAHVAWLVPRSEEPGFSDMLCIQNLLGLPDVAILGLAFRNSQDLHVYLCFSPRL